MNDSTINLFNSLRNVGNDRQTIDRIERLVERTDLHGKKTSMVAFDSMVPSGSEIHQERLAQALAKLACAACNGTGWVSRDSDIGTEQECFVCGGSGDSDEESELSIEETCIAVNDPNGSASYLRALADEIDAGKHVGIQSVDVFMNNASGWTHRGNKGGRK